MSPAARLSALYAAVFAIGGVAMPFLPLWLGARGLGPEAIGALLTLPILVRIGLAAPLMGLVDRGVRPRTLLVAGGLTAAASYAMMPAAATGGILLLALAIAANAAVSCPFVPTADYLTLAAVRAGSGLDYARIRLWGSLAFLAANLAGGAGLARLPDDATVWLLASLAGAVALAGWGTARPDPEVRPDPKARRDPKAFTEPTVHTEPDAARPGPSASERAPLPAALRVAILAAAAVQASHAAAYAFSSLHWRGSGLSESTIGALWAVGVGAEIALFLAYGWSRRGLSRPFALIGLGAGAGLVRWVGLALAPPDPLWLGALQVLHGLTFGATHLGTMAAVSGLAPPGSRGRAQGLVGTVGALASAAATLAAGAAFRAEGGPAAFLLMVPLCLAGLGLAAAGAGLSRSRPTG